MPLQYRTACPLTIKFTPFPRCTDITLTSEYEPPPPAQLGTASPSSLKYDPSHPNIDVQLCVTMLKALQLLVC